MLTILFIFAGFWMLRGVGSLAYYVYSEWKNGKSVEPFGVVVWLFFAPLLWVGVLLFIVITPKAPEAGVNR
jgi:hypothetical protein